MNGKLKRAVTDGAIASAVIFSILPETPSGPVDLVVSIDFNSSVTSSTVQSKSSGQGWTWFRSRPILHTSTDEDYEDRHAALCTQQQPWHKLFPLCKRQDWCKIFPLGIKAKFVI